MTEPTSSIPTADEHSAVSRLASIRFCVMNTIFMHFCRQFFTYYCPLTVVGRENIPAEPFIFCSNHTSHMDSAVLMTASGLPFQRCAMVAAQDYFFEHSRKRNLTQLLMNLIPIDRHASKESMLSSIKLCEQFIRRGNQSLIIYPEGTRSQNGELQTFKKGSAWIAMRLNLPIVPVYIHGTHVAMPKGACFPKSRRLSAIIGKPILPSDYTWVDEEGVKRANAKSYRLITENLQTQIQLLKEQAIGS